MQSYEELAATISSSEFEARPVVERLGLLEAAAAALSARAEPNKDVAAMERVIDLIERSVDTAPVESARHGMAVINLASSLGTLYDWTRDDAVLRRAATEVVRWINSVPPDDWRAPLYILASAVLGYRCALAAESDETDAAAVQALEAARSLVKPGSGVHVTATALLADLRLNRYDRTWSLEDLTSALNDAFDVLRAPRASRIERHDSLKVAAYSLVLRFEALDSLEDLDGALAVAQVGLTEATSDDDRAPFQEIIGRARRHRFRALEDPADLDLAIDAARRVAELTTLDSQRATAMDNYANALASRFRVTGEVNDLREAIAVSRAAFALMRADDPSGARLLSNVGRTLLDLHGVTRDHADLSSALDVLRRALAYDTPDPSVSTRLNVSLGEAILRLAAVDSQPAGLIREALGCFAVARAVASGLAKHVVAYETITRERSLWIIDAEVAALLWLAELEPADAPDLVRTALEIGEAAKAQQLSARVARLPLPPPDGVAKELLHREWWLLGQLTSLDNRDANGLPWSHLRKITNRRKAAVEELDRIWSQIASVGPAGIRYVQMRRSPDRAWVDTVRHGDGGTAVLSLLPIRDVRIAGDLDTVGIAVISIVSDADPTIVAVEPRFDPVTAAGTQFDAEVPGDSGLGVRRETWHRSLTAVLGNQTPRSIGHARTIVVSPPRDGYGLPWHLVFDRAGWRSVDGASFPVITVPTLTILRAGTRDAGGQPPARQLQFVYVHDPSTLLTNVLRMAQGWEGPLVVGNPTADLPAAETEALQVAESLGVPAYIGEQATVELARRALSQAPIIHLAAHARFDAIDPLNSEIFLHDGAIAARELMGAYSEAELIVLSSCDGGAAGRVAGGEIAGLGHALLRAGARAVLAALWPVDDDATGFLMTAFYHGRRAGLAEPNALAEAMRLTREQPGWQHPYFWSGIILMQGG